MFEGRDERRREGEEGRRAGDEETLPSSPPLKGGCAWAWGASVDWPAARSTWKSDFNWCFVCFKCFEWHSHEVEGEAELAMWENKAAGACALRPLTRAQPDVVDVVVDDDDTIDDDDEDDDDGHTDKLMMLLLTSLLVIMKLLLMWNEKELKQMVYNCCDIAGVHVVVGSGCCCCW